MDEVHMRLPLCDGMQAVLITYYYTKAVLLSGKRHEKIVYAKIKILPSFSHPHAVPNLYKYMIYSYGLILRNLIVLTCYIT